MSARISIGRATVSGLLDYKPLLELPEMGRAARMMSRPSGPGCRACRRRRMARAAAGEALRAMAAMAGSGRRGVLHAMILSRHSLRDPAAPVELRLDDGSTITFNAREVLR